MRKIHTSLYLGLSIFISLLLLSMVIFFFRIIQNKNRHTMAVMTTLENKITEKKNIDTLIKKVDHINNTNRLVESHFVDPTKIDDLVGYLESLGESQSAVLSVKSVKASEKENDNKIDVEIVIEGEFTNILKIIGFLENSLYQITIDSVYLNKNILPEKDKITGSVNEQFLPWQTNISLNILSLK